MNASIRVGLIGYGIAGQVFHAPVLTSVEGLQLVKIQASKPEQVQLAHSRYPEAQTVNSNEDIINDERIELVVVATPNTSHFSLSKKALLAGKNVVVEKPFTITSSEADELIEVAAEQKKILAVHHNKRFDSDFLTAAKVVKSGMLGELVEFESHYDRFRNYLRPGAWREEDIPGAGILYDLGVHLVDQAHKLFGLPEAITADIRIQRKSAKATDNFELILHYNKLKITLKAGMLVREPLPRYILLGQDGTFVKYGSDVQEQALRAGLSPLDTPNWGVEPETSWGKINTEYNGLKITGRVESEPGNYMAFYKNIHDAIHGKAELVINPKEARNTIRVIELAIQSHRERRTVDYSER